MEKTITVQEYEKLKKLKNSASELQKIIDGICEEAESITEESVESLTFDYIHNDFLTVDELLEKLEITVVEEVRTRSKKKD